MNVPFTCKFQSLSDKFPIRISETNLSHSTAQVRRFIVQKRKFQIFGLKNVMDGGKNKKNSHFRNTLNFTSNFREKSTEAFVISKRLKFP